MIAIAQYSASLDDQETVGWFFVFQEIKEPRKETKYPITDSRVMGQLAQACKESEESTLSKIP